MFQTQRMFRTIAIAQPAALLACLLLLMAPQQLAAQVDTPDAKITVTDVDVSRFPEVDTYIFEQNVGADGSTVGEVTLYEDGMPQDLLNSTTSQVGIQTALILDAAGNIDRAGVTGEPRYIEAGLAARRLVELGLLSAETDWLMPIAFGTDERAAALRDWSHDHQAAADALYTYQKPANIGYTPLFDLIRFAIMRFEDSNLPEHQARSMVVFSDGIDVVSTTELTDAINAASDRGIRIHTVMLGPQDSGPRRNLERIAALTGGRYVHLDSPDAVDELWQLLGQERSQTVLTYRSAKQQPGEIMVGIKLGTRSLTSKYPVPATSIQPAAVQITAPAAGAVFVRNAEAYDTPTNQMEPRTLDVETVFGWPDRKPRGIQRMEYQIGGVTITRDEGPFEPPFTVSMAELGQGTYSLRVRIIDELGMVAESLPVTFGVEEVRPPAPTPTPDAALVEGLNQAQQALAGTQEELAGTQQQLDQTQEQLVESQQQAQEAAAALQQQLADAAERLKQMGWLSIASLAFGLIALGLAIYILSSRDRRRRATEIVTGTVKAVTEPFVRGGKRSSNGSAASVAKLTLVDAGGTAGMPHDIPLHRGRVTIGRDPEMVNVPIQDRRVSRYHCRINEEGNQFRLWDEGSTSGTYVNDDEVGHAGRILMHGDIIEIGPVRYRFEEARDGSDMGDDTVFSDPKMFDRTEVYIRRNDGDR